MYKGALNCVGDFFISKAENEDLAALGQGFSTYEMEESTARYASLYVVIGINVIVKSSTYQTLPKRVIA